MRPNILRLVSLTGMALLAGCATAQVRPTPVQTLPIQSLLANSALCERVLALDAEHLSTEDITSTLSKCPAPRIFNFNGSAFNTMDSFSRFLAGMGYPETALRSGGGALSLSSFQDAEKVAQGVRVSRESEKMRPMLIGHSQGGAFVMKVLHRLEPGSVSYASAIATGKWMRYLLGQWDMVPILRKVPDSVEEFTGYRLAGDLIGSDLPGVKASGNYEAEGTARVRNVVLEGAGHLSVTHVEALERFNAYTPDAPGKEEAKFFFAADIWYHVKKHWCLELQNLIREKSQKNVS